MAMPRWEDGKIAIVGAMKYKNQFNEPQISWFENIEELNCDKFDFVLDVSQASQVTLITDDEKILIHTGEGDILPLLKSLISLFLDMSILDADFADIKTVIENGCTFKYLSTSEDDVKDNIESWVKENIRDCCNSMFIHFQTGGDNLSLMEMSDISERISDTLKVVEENIIFSISGEEYKEADIKISFWFR